MNIIHSMWVLANSDEYLKVGVGHVSQSIQYVENSHVVQLSGCVEILQSDWSWWNSTMQ